MATAKPLSDGSLKKKSFTSSRCMSTWRAACVKCRNSETEEAEEKKKRSFRGFTMKRLTHAISARPSGPTLGAVAATYKEVIPGAPCSIVAALTILKHTATCKEESGKHKCESCEGRAQRRRRANKFVAGQSPIPACEFFQTSCHVSFRPAALNSSFPATKR